MKATKVLMVVMLAVVVGSAVAWADPKPDAASITLLVGRLCGGGGADQVVEEAGLVVNVSLGNVYLGGGGAYLVLGKKGKVKCVVCGGEGDSFIFSAGPLPELSSSTRTGRCVMRPIAELIAALKAQASEKR